MNEAFVELNKVRSKIVTYGRWIEESSGTTNKVIILIPGNPGMVGFYKDFAKLLYEKTEIPVWCLSHAGHNFADKSTVTMPSFQENQHLYGLEGQVKHKIDFFKKYVPADAKVYLIGHSIGAYMALEALEDESIKNKIEETFLLFPTIEYMAKTRNGWFLNTLVRPIVPLVLFLCWIFTILPSFFASLLLYSYMYIANMPRQTQANNIKDLLKPGLLRRVFFLAFEEMDQVKERNTRIIQQNVDKIRFLYGRTDGWTPEKYYDGLKRDVPLVKAELTDCNHAFIFHHTNQAADRVIDWIKSS